MAEKLEIPVWNKAVLSLEEAAAYGNLNVHLLRGFSVLAAAGKSNFPVFYSGDTMKIPRVSFERWLEGLGDSHSKLELKVVQRMVSEAKEPAKRGRPRKERCI